MLAFDVLIKKQRKKAKREKLMDFIEIFSLMNERIDQFDVLEDSTGLMTEGVVFIF